MDPDTELEDLWSLEEGLWEVCGSGAGLENVLLCGEREESEGDSLVTEIVIKCGRLL